MQWNSWSSRGNYPTNPMVHHNKAVNKLFSGLGKATRRGVRKCYKCGQINGTRGYACKNKQCDVVFKEYSDRRRVNLEAVKLTGTSKQVYSVRVRDKGPDYRGFVQLRSTDNGINLLLSDNAICFVDSCQRLFDDSILRCHEAELNKVSPLCAHVESALQSDIVATQINLKESTLNLIKIPFDVKQKLWELISAGQGAVIQRVSKYVMVVKCAVSAKHPLGYLHFTFGKSKGKDVFDDFLCSCADGKSQNGEEVNYKCIHYYACVCSFASNARLMEEFMNFINLEFEIGFTRMHFKNIRAQKNQASCDERGEKAIETKIKVKKIKDASPKKHFLSSHGRKAKQSLATNQHLSINRHNSIVSHKTLNASIDFNQWFISVIELVNNCLLQSSLSMDSSVNCPIFLIPQVRMIKSFFDLLRERIKTYAPDSCLPRFMEKRFENNNNSISNRFIWQLWNLSEIAAIFTTTKISLRAPKNDVQRQINDQSTFAPSRINHANVPLLVIEWTPNVQQISLFGELELKFNLRRNVTK